MYFHSVYKSPLGNIIIACDESYIVGLWFEGQKYERLCLKNKKSVYDDVELILKAKRWLDRYFAGACSDVDTLPLAPIGTEFQKIVWGILSEIPYGEVVTYKDVAKKAALKMGVGRMSAQAVGGAVGHNQISIIIPCHRVIGSDGSLTGYAGGVDRKKKLLLYEGVDLSGFKVT